MSTESVRLQIFDDGAGEYIFDAPIDQLSCAGRMGSNPSGPFILPSPLVVCKPGLLTVALTNVTPISGNDGTSLQVCMALVFAVPKRCKGAAPNGARKIDPKGLIT